MGHLVKRRLRRTIEFSVALRPKLPISTQRRHCIS